MKGRMLAAAITALPVIVVLAEVAGRKVAA